MSVTLFTATIVPRLYFILFVPQNPIFNNTSCKVVWWVDNRYIVAIALLTFPTPLIISVISEFLYTEKQCMSISFFSLKCSIKGSASILSAVTIKTISSPCYFDIYLSLTWSVKFTEIYALPCSQYKSSVFNNYLL